MRNPDLTPGEWRVAECLMEGMSNKEIAHRLCNELPTIKNHIKSILHKLGAKDRTHAVVILYRRKCAEANEGWLVNAPEA